MAEFFQTCWDKVLWLIGLANPDNLREFAQGFRDAGTMWIGYAILAAIVFSETGLLVGFFLPGDSMLFAAGFLASPALEIFDIFTLNLCLMAAAILGDAVNYYVGLWMSEGVFEKGRLRFVKHEHLIAAKEFYERHGGLAIVLARFVPLVRTFTPFVAGVAQMKYRQFVIYNIAGGVGWVASMTGAGYFLGGIPFVKTHFEKVVIGIVVVSVLPVVIGVLRKFLKSRQPADQPTNPQA